MNEKPFVSIIIVNYNGARFLQNCFSSLFKTNYQNYEIIIVDNASTDKSLEVIQTIAGAKDNVKVIRNTSNLGFGPANNVGFDHAIGDYIVFLNNDTSVEPEWLSILVNTMENDKTIGLAQSLILNMYSHMIQTAGFIKCDYWVSEYSVGKNRDESEIVFPQVFEISTAMGAGMMARRDFLLEIGLFDPKYFWYYDDEYLSFKTWLAGKRVVTVSGSKVYHFGGGTSKKVHASFAEYRYFTINNISLVIDVYWNLIDLTKALSVAFLHIIYGSLLELFFLKRATLIHGNLTAVYWITKNLKYIWSNRVKYWKNAKINNKTLLSRMIKLNIPLSAFFVSRFFNLYFENAVEKYKKTNHIILVDRKTLDTIR